MGVWIAGVQSDFNGVPRVSELEPRARSEQHTNPFRPGNTVPPPNMAGRDRPAALVYPREHHAWLRHAAVRRLLRPQTRSTGLL
jgi:hypothetical protein